MGEYKIKSKEGTEFCFTPKLLIFMKTKGKKKTKRIESFPVVHSHAAGIDVGDTEMVVAVSPDVCVENVRTFGTFSCDHDQIVSFLQDCGIKHVAMESTGIYWLQLFLRLQEEEFDVILANAKTIKNVSGRKDDENDAMWIQRLHSCGLINGSFQPDNQTRALRDLTRHRRTLVRDQSRCLNRMIKALELMNIKIQTVISDIDGQTGKAIVEAILAGEREASVLASLASKRIKASRRVLIKSLQGNWNTQALFLLKQNYATYNFISTQITETDFEVEQQLQRLIATYNGGELPLIDHKQARKRSTRKNTIPFNATAYLKTLLRTDLTQIPGISELTALELIAETGKDMNKWPTENHFSSWLAIVPNTKKSGGKIISNKVMKKKQRAGQTLRMAAFTLKRSNTPLGNYYRKQQAKGGPAKAVLATATKMAIAIYNMILKQQPYKPEKMIESQHKFKEQQIKNLEARLAILKAAA